jgi:hypothetical protein
MILKLVYLFLKRHIEISFLELIVELSLLAYLSGLRSNCV